MTMGLTAAGDMIALASSTVSHIKQADETHETQYFAKPRGCRVVTHFENESLPVAERQCGLRNTTFRIENARHISLAKLLK